MIASAITALSSSLRLKNPRLSISWSLTNKLNAWSLYEHPSNVERILALIVLKRSKSLLRWTLRLVNSINSSSLRSFTLTPIFTPPSFFTGSCLAGLLICLASEIVGIPWRLRASLKASSLSVFFTLDASIPYNLLRISSAIISSKFGWSVNSSDLV